ncbi:Fic family protein [Mariniluteicoccus flavus]
MGTWHAARWQSQVVGFGTSADRRRSGTFRWYLPGPIQGRTFAFPPALDAELAQVERRVRRLTLGPEGGDLAALSRFLVRSEAIASSKIEGIAPAARQAAMAELAQTEILGGISAQAELVARNMTLVREASQTLAQMEHVTVEAVTGLHSALLADEPRHHGLRTEQNWIGGSNHHPLDADFVPPAPTQVPALMNDLVGYLNGATHSALVQAALVHAQFETIHPFTDGNGRLGRALIHTVLVRRGLTPSAVLPISLVLATFSEAYISGLTAFRHTDDTDDHDQRVATWVTEFIRATGLAADQADRLRTAIADLRLEWIDRVERHREAQGRQRGMRSDSATALILADLPSTPVLTATTVRRIHGVSAVAAGRALIELQEAGILDSRSAGRGIRAYAATDVLDLVTVAERQLASTKFDTRARLPGRPVPAAPASTDR